MKPKTALDFLNPIDLPFHH